MVRVTCPRCGFPGYLKIVNVNGRNYVYVQHWQRKTKACCYLGPEWKIRKLFKRDFINEAIERIMSKELIELHEEFIFEEMIELFKKRFKK